MGVDDEDLGGISFASPSMDKHFFAISLFYIKVKEMKKKQILLVGAFFFFF